MAVSHSNSIHCIHMAMMNQCLFLLWEKKREKQTIYVYILHHHKINEKRHTQQPHMTGLELLFHVSLLLLVSHTCVRVCLLVTRFLSWCVYTRTKVCRLNSPVAVAQFISASKLQTVSVVHNCSAKHPQTTAKRSLKKHGTSVLALMWLYSSLLDTCEILFTGWIERVAGFGFAWDFPSKHLLSSISYATHPGIRSS